MAEWAKLEDFDEILKKSDIIFGGEDNTDYFQLYHPKLYAVRNSATEHLVVQDGDGIQGILGVFPAEMEVCGRSLKIDGFGTMGVMKTARGKGYMKELMNTAVGISEKRADIAFLGGRRQRYEYFGFTPSGVAASFSFNRDNARHGLKGESADYTFKPIDGESDTQLFLSLYNRRPARVLRSPDMFTAILKTCRSQPVGIYANGQPFGYAAVNGEGRSINEIELIDNAKLPEVLGAYLKATELKGVAVNGVFAFEREKLSALDGICEVMSLPCCESFRIHSFVKVINAFLALKATYAPLYPCNTVLGIVGHKNIRIDIDKGGFEVCETEKTADAVLTPIEATRALFGNGAYFWLGAKLPEDLRANLPLPLFYSRPDFV